MNVKTNTQLISKPLFNSTNDVLSLILDEIRSIRKEFNEKAKLMVTKKDFELLVSEMCDKCNK